MNERKRKLYLFFIKNIWYDGLSIFIMASNPIARIRNKKKIKFLIASGSEWKPKIVDIQIVSSALVFDKDYS